MIYKHFKDKKLSALGLGTMRLPTKGKDSEIDMEKTAEIIDYAIKNGINYFDTAWGYHGGKSEIAVGEILSKYPRFEHASQPTGSYILALSRLNLYPHAFSTFSIYFLSSAVISCGFLHLLHNLLTNLWEITVTNVDATS